MTLEDRVKELEVLVKLQSDHIDRMMALMDQHLALIKSLSQTVEVISRRGK